MPLADASPTLQVVLDATAAGGTAGGSTMRTRIGIIGDKAGAGKSYVMLALVQAGLGAGSSPAPDPIVRSFAGNRVLVSMTPRVDTIGVSVLVVPHNLCAQWERYLESFGGGFRHASVNRAKHLIPLREAGALDALDLIVVTSTFHNSVAALLSGRRVRRVLYDEADSLVISCCHPIDADFHWFATASYRNLLYPHGDGDVLLDSLSLSNSHSAHRRTNGLRSSGFIKQMFVELSLSDHMRVVGQAIVAKNADGFVDASMHLPDPVVHIVPCKSPIAVRVLSGIADRQVMECLNAGDVDGALQHVSQANRRSEEGVIAALMGKLERAAHNLEARIAVLPTFEYDSEEARESEGARLALKLEALNTRMACIRERVVSCDTCPICFDGLTNKTVSTCCSNAFCFACINKWLGNRSVCPLCKDPLTLAKLLVVTPGAEDPGAAADSSSSAGQSDPASGVTDKRNDKIRNLEAIVTDRCMGSSRSGGTRSKMLIFSSFDNAFNDIAAMLDRVGVRHRFLKGNHFSVACIEREYRNGDLDVLLVNTSNYGSGLNFENTTDVVMLHKFDTDIEHQVIGRAQRCGRTAPLNVWYLMYENEGRGRAP